MLQPDQKPNLRHEYKYLLEYGTYLQLRELLQKLMKMDNHSKSEDGYHIRSLYFDDMYDTAVKEKTLGYINRQKFRVRIYDFSDKVIKMEIKEKYQDYISKSASTITRFEYEKIVNGEIGFLHRSRNSVREKYFMEFRNNMLKPKVIVDYLREAYVLQYNQIRITFDKNLSAAKPCKNIFNKNINSTHVGQEYTIIMEVKYNNFLPGYLRSILEMYCHNRLAVSKYLICREYLAR